MRKLSEMDTVIINLKNDDRDEAVSRAASVLTAGGIVAFPTDTVYGLGAVYSQEQAVKRVFSAKERPENKPLSILVCDISQVEMLAQDIPEDAYKLMKAFWPGALTLILKLKKDACVPEEITAGKDTIGVRMPDSRLALDIIRAAGAPLAAPSANISGERSACRADQVTQDLAGRIDMIIDGGDCPIGLSSTIIDLSGPSYRLLRQGSISPEDIKKVTGDHEI